MEATLDYLRTSTKPYQRKTIQRNQCNASRFSQLRSKLFPLLQTDERNWCACNQSGCLRKTNFSSLAAYDRGDITPITGHSPKGQVLPKHYIDPKVIAAAEKSQDFAVFPKE